jgi:hypothetical protein
MLSGATGAGDGAGVRLPSATPAPPQRKRGRPRRIDTDTRPPAAAGDVVDAAPGTAGGQRGKVRDALSGARRGRPITSDWQSILNSIVDLDAGVKPKCVP